MKKYASFFLAAALGTFLVLSSRKHEGHIISDKPLTIYDTAVMMLKEFIIEGQDSNLGFKNFAELDEAELRVSDSIRVYYLLEDSLLQNKSPLDSQLVRLNRCIFPVYYHNQLRSSITFDLTKHGWKPVIFDDSNVIAPYIKKKHDPPTAAVIVREFAVVEAPFVHNDLIIERDNTGDHILPTKELRREMGADLPAPGGMMDLTPVGKNEFVKDLQQHMHKVLGQ